MTSQLREILTELGHIEAEISNFISIPQDNYRLLKLLQDLRISEVNQEIKGILSSFNNNFLENDAEITKLIIMLGKISTELSNIENFIRKLSIIIQQPKINFSIFHSPKKDLTVALQGHLRTIREELNKLTAESLTDKQSPGKSLASVAKL